MRPLHNNQPKQSDDAKKLWESADRAKRIEYHDGEEVFHLTQKEAQKCRFEITNQSMRLAQCTVHTESFTHGLTLHPPHLWDIREGILYKNVNNEWVKFIPSIKENTSRLKDA